MTIAYHIFSVISILLFLFYGWSCLSSEKMEAEFERFGLERWRTLTGILEIAGALGLAAGYLAPALALAAASGLTLLMAMVVVRRAMLRDSLAETLPALVLCLMNGYVAFVALELTLR